MRRSEISPTSHGNLVVQEKASGLVVPCCLTDSPKSTGPQVRRNVLHGNCVEYSSDRPPIIYPGRFHARGRLFAGIRNWSPSELQAVRYCQPRSGLLCCQLAQFAIGPQAKSQKLYQLNQHKPDNQGLYVVTIFVKQRVSQSLGFTPRSSMPSESRTFRFPGFSTLHLQSSIANSHNWCYCNLILA
ncbi:hypothetical protein BJX63DRAFT_182401 [Aspergillus granulosus]|uniref:Uncharacterized protein n=1 Tax=Aspergillus granulosus TaxID=176169 RepID=A0ABR4I470_9EURO